MTVVFHYDREDWRPSWPQMLGIIERYCHEEETAEELRWLRAHPTDWLMVARYMRTRTENHIAETRKAIKDMVVTDPETGRPRREYLRAKAADDKLNGKRLHWIAKLDEQINEAKYVLGWERVSVDLRAELIDRLLVVRASLTSARFDQDETLRIVEGLLRIYAPDFDPDVYRPAKRESDSMMKPAKVDRQHAAQMTVREVHENLVGALGSDGLTMSDSFSLDHAEDLMGALDVELAELRAFKGGAVKPWGDLPHVAVLRLPIPVEGMDPLLNAMRIIYGDSVGMESKGVFLLITKPPSHPEVAPDS